MRGLVSDMVKKIEQGLGRFLTKIRKAQKNQTERADTGNATRCPTAEQAEFGSQFTKFSRKIIIEIIKNQ